MDMSISEVAIGGCLAWVVLAKNPSGRSEAIKITNHEEADQLIKNNPDIFYKSGPIWLGAPQIQEGSAA